jgi:hypothetical protein
VDVDVTVTERQRVQISREPQPGVPPGAPPLALGGDPKAAKKAEKEAAKRAKAAKSSSMADQSPIVKTVRKLFGRSKDASA